MKKLFFPLMLALFACTGEETPLIDLTGTWAGLGIGSQGGLRISAVLNHDTTTGNVNGFIFVENTDHDTLALSGSARADRFAGIAYGSCASNVDLTIANDGNKLTGQSADRPAGDSCHGSDQLTLYRVLPPNQNVTGSWSGTFSGNDGNGTLDMTLTQSGAVMTGTLLANDGSGTDTNAFNGIVLGDAMFAVATKDSADSTWVLVDVQPSFMDGIFANSNKNTNGTVHITKTAGKKK